MSLHQKLLTQDPEQLHHSDGEHKKDCEAVEIAEAESSTTCDFAENQEFLLCAKLAARFDPLSVNVTKPCVAKILYALITILTFTAIPYLAYRTAYDGQLQWTSIYVASFFVLWTLPISIHEIMAHLTNWYMPDVQKYVVRILFLVPVYSLQSWCSLLLSHRGHSNNCLVDCMELFRDLYEALAISSFVYYLVALLGGEQELSHRLRYKDPKYGHHSFPIQCLLKLVWGKGEWNMGEEFMLHCKHGVLVFVVIKTVATIVTVLMLKPMHLYGEGEFDFHKGFIYITTILNLSMAWAMYCLIKLFYATKDELRNWHPIGKFLCIKGVVFFTFWQGFGIMCLQHAGILQNIGSWDAVHVRRELQQVLVCTEMLGFAIAHRYTFTHSEYMRTSTYTHETDNEIRASLLTDDDNEFEPHEKCEDCNSINVDSNEEKMKCQKHCTKLRPLSQPMSFGAAVWSSTVPNETFSDVKRLRRGPPYVTKLNRECVMEENESDMDYC